MTAPSVTFLSCCEVCGIPKAQFPTAVERLRFELKHEHGGAD